MCFTTFCFHVVCQCVYIDIDAYNIAGCCETHFNPGLAYSEYFVLLYLLSDLLLCEHNVDFSNELKNNLDNNTREHDILCEGSDCTEKNQKHQLQLCKLTTHTNNQQYDCVCAAEVSNLLVVTKEREQAPQKPMVTFDRILKEDLEQVRHLKFMSVSRVRKAMQFL